jgi:acetyl esterase
MPPDNRSLQQLRQTTHFTQYKQAGPPARPYPAADVTRLTITPDSIRVLVFNPTHAQGLPIIIQYHGGGFIQPLVPWMEQAYWQEAQNFQAIVFAVDYRVAPEHRFPAAGNDCYRAFQWISEHGTAYGGDTSRLVLKGESAGATLVAVVAQRAKQAGLAHRIKLQVMICPATDHPRHAARYPSMQENATGYFLTTAGVLFAGETYAAPKDYANPAVAPILAKNVAGLPPAVLVTAEFDPLRDQGAAYAARLVNAGVRVWYHCFPGQIYVLLTDQPVSRAQQEANALVRLAMIDVLKR